MKRYLLFDSKCTLCTNIAAKVKDETSGLIVGRSLHDPEIKRVLDEAKPSWRFEPTLLEIEEDSVRAYTKLSMRLQLVRVLGIRKAWKLADLIQHEFSKTNVDSERRNFLTTVAKWAFIVGVAPISSSPHVALAETKKRNPNEPGTEAKKLGVTKYQQEIQDINGYRAMFEHRDSKKNAVVQESLIGRIRQVSLTRGKHQLLIVMNSDLHRVDITDAVGRHAGFTADWEKREWVPDDDNSTVVLNENMKDFQLIGAISLDFSPVEDATIDTMSVTAQVYCPCNTSALRGWCTSTTRSQACECATNDVNVRCSNGWCIGCCRLLSCDCICVAGDYMCECGRYGYDCTSRCS